MRPSVAVVVVALALRTTPVRGDVTLCPPMAEAAPALGAIDANMRLRFVRDTMRDQAQRARVWTWTWGLTGTALAAGSFIYAGLTNSQADRIDQLVGGGASLLIPAALLIKPLSVIADDGALEKEATASSAGNASSDPCALLARAEFYLVDSADDEAFSAGIVAHALAVGVNGAIALGLGLGLGHWEGGLLNGGGGLVLSEIQIFTQPTGAVSALASYRSGVLGAPARSTGIRWSLSPASFSGALGFQLSGAY